MVLADLPPTQRQVLVALARPYKHDEFATPATNQEIASELFLSVDAVKSHLRTLFARFGIEHLPQNQKRSRLVAEALQSGVIATARSVIALGRYASRRNWCTKAIAMLPSPTAAATRLTGPERTSPHAKMPGTLVSSR